MYNNFIAIILYSVNSYYTQLSTCSYKACIECIHIGLNFKIKFPIII